MFTVCMDSISYVVINLKEKIQIYGRDHVKKKISYHFSHFYDQHKSLSEKFVSIGSCSTMTTLCSVFKNLPFYKLCLKEILKLTDHSFK